MSGIANNAFVNAHQNAWNEALSVAPELNVNELIGIAVDFMMGRKDIDTKIKGLSEEYRPAIEQYLRSLSEEAVRNVVIQSDEPVIQKLAEGDFAEKLKDTSAVIAGLVQSYMNKDINAAQFVHGLVNSGFKDVCGDFLQAADIDKSVLYDSNGALRSLASPIIGYCATVKAYEMMMKALEDASAAFEHRLQIEEECRKTIELIRQYRAEMEKAVNRYLTRHYKTFEHAFNVMNHALIENDSDSYIRGNAEIQKLLGYQMQFSNQDEFDELMDSDLALKL